MSVLQDLTRKASERANCASCDLAEDMLVEWQRSDHRIDDAKADRKKHRRAVEAAEEDIARRKALIAKLPDGAAKDRLNRDIDRAIGPLEAERGSLHVAEQAIEKHTASRDEFMEAAHAAHDCGHIGYLTEPEGWNTATARFSGPPRLVTADDGVPFATRFAANKHMWHRPRWGGSTKPAKFLLWPDEELVEVPGVRSTVIDDMTDGIMGVEKASRS